jgi:hypothetical protein
MLNPPPPGKPPPPGGIPPGGLPPPGNPPPPIGGCAAADAQISAIPQAIEMSNLAFIVLLKKLVRVLVVRCFSQSKV